MNLTIDTHHHMLPDFFYEETNDVHAPVGGLAFLLRNQRRKNSLASAHEF